MAAPESWIATRPVPSPGADDDALARWWGIRDVVSEELPSERDRNVLVRPGGGGAPVVLKVSNRAEDPAFLTCQEEAMVRLAAAGVPVARSVPALDGRTVVDLGAPGPPLARVLTWLPGRPLATVETPSDALLANIGSTMGRVASALADFDHPAAHRVFQWDVMRALEAIEAGLRDLDDPRRRALLSSARVGLHERLVPVLPSLRTTIIHNDANDHNVLVDDAGERVVGLLDFGDMVHSVTAQEAAVATTYAMFHRTDPTTVIAPLVGAFDRACPLTDPELDALGDLILARVGASVAIAARQGRLDPDPYLRISEAPAWTLLEWLQDTGAHALRAVVHEAVGR